MMRWRSGAFAFEPRGLPCLNHSGPRGATATESAHDAGAASPTTTTHFLVYRIVPPPCSGASAQALRA
ncbi:hypothetical protein, partial [Paenibacillus polysaccharolyticus]|uniref:hypothetical protein n=1 Tax=Paenibacillus polysaccharolyticus TaxID=582692 RepID=UPI001ABF2343